MRGFMRAIGLGGLFKQSARHSGKQRHPSTGRAMGSLAPVDDIQLTMPDQNAARLSTRTHATARRESSVYEAPQFLFFCGSDNSGVAAARRGGYQAGAKDFSFESAEVQARASTKSPKIVAPQISHRMPVFFAPQHVMPNSFE